MEGKIHIDAALSNISVGYRNGEFIAERVLPVVPVGKKSDRYYVQGKERFRARNDRRTPGAEATPSRMTLSDSPYFCEGHALKDFVPREDTNNADPALDLLGDTTEYLTEQVGLNQEVATVAAIVAGVSASSQAAKQWNSDDVDPLAIIKEGMATVVTGGAGKRPNALAISRPVFTAVTMNANVRGLLTGANSLPGTLITPAMLAAVLELDEVIVGEATYDTANEGAAASLGWVWSDYALLFHRAASPGLKTLSLGYTFAWRAALAAVAGAGQAEGVNGIGAQFVRRYSDEKTISDIVEVHKYYDPRIVAADAGLLFTNCV